VSAAKTYFEEQLQLPAIKHISQAETAGRLARPACFALGLLVLFCTLYQQSHFNADFILTNTP
jgi:hypothetical protein